MVHSRFLKFFPLPAFLQMPSAGVNMSDEAIRFVRFSGANGALKVAAFGEKALPAGAIVAGHIVNQNEVVKVLVEMRRQHDIRFVRATLPDEKIYVFKTALPSIAVEDIRKALEFKLEEHVPIAVADSVFDYTVEKSQPDGSAIEVVVGVIAQAEASAYADAFRAAGMTPLSFEIESQAIASALVPKGDNGLVLIVHLGSSSTGIYLIKDGIVHFSNTLQSEVSDAPGPGEPKEKRSANLDKIYSPKYKRLPMIREEIEKLASYWQEHGGQENAAISRVIVCGRDAMDAELVEYFTGLIKRDVSVGNAWANAEFPEHYVPDLHQDESLRYAAAIGAALSEFKH